MRHLLFVGHARYAEGLRAAVEMLMGEREWIASCSMTEDGDFAQLLADTLANVGAEDEVVLLADIAGGSPECLTRQRLAEIGIPSARVCGFGGANLPMALSAVMGIEEGLDLAAIADSLLSEGQTAVRQL